MEQGSPPPSGPPPWRLDLNRLSDGTAHRLSPSAGGHLAEAASVCLEAAGHAPGCRLRVEGDREGDARLDWEAASDTARRTHADLQEATEEGACGLAILLAFQCTEYQVVQRSWKGTGFDYALGSPSDPNYIRARLEVSGIQAGSRPVVERRVAQKLRQTDRSDATGLPAYIAVVEFGTPLSVFRRK